MLRSLCAAAALVGVCGALAFALEPTRDQSRPAPPPTPRVLPGVRTGGDVQLPNGWSLRPAGKHVALGDFPVNVALHPGGKWAAVLHAGYGEHEIVVVGLGGDKPRVVSRVSLDQTFYGICFAPDGKTLYASGGEFEVVHAFAFDKGLLSDHREIAVAPVADKFIVAGVAVDAAGHTLFAAGAWGDAVALVPLDDPNEPPHRCRSTRTAIPTPVCPIPRATGCSSACGARPASPSSTRRRRKSSRPSRRNRTRRKWPWPRTARPCTSPAPTRRRSAWWTRRRAKIWRRMRLLALPQRPFRQHAQQPRPDAGRPDALRRQRRRQQPRRLQRHRAGQAPSRWASSRPAGIRPRCATTRPTGGSTSPTARACPRGPTRKAPAPTCRRQCDRLSNTSPALLQGTLSVIDLPGPDKMADYTKQAYACSPLRATWRWSATGRTTTRSRTRPAAPARSNTASTSSRRTAPTTRCSAT